MGRHPWVAEADNGIRWGIQLVLGDAGMETLRERARLVEQLGFDGFFLFDHPALQPDPWLCLAALSSVTEKVRLGSVVNCVGYRHPAALARYAADLDNLSNGRLMLGLGIGWLAPEFAAFDLPFPPPAERYAQLEETLAILPGLWGDEKFSFSGERYRVNDLQIMPPPAQQPRPPLMIGGSGEARTLRLVARHADACNINEVTTTSEGMRNTEGVAGVRRKLEVLQSHCDAAGRPYEEILRTHFTIKLVIGQTAAAAEQKLAAILASPSTSPGTRRSHRSAFVVGSPETVAAHYRAIAAVGIQYFVVQVDAAETETLDLLAAEVVPRVG
ncbi:MAG TPA: LLM class flavin-dependent oxidoreductase [Thermomicrobiales bacterium]|nr:LLM class flavin-dependent oxidoreductase [Thermomicrobiales bacterium]